MAYVRFNWQDNACIQFGPKLDKKILLSNLVSSTHSILWICIGLSTLPSHFTGRAPMSVAHGSYFHIAGKVDRDLKAASAASRVAG